MTAQTKALLDMPEASGNMVAKTDFEMRSMYWIGAADTALLLRAHPASEWAMVRQSRDTIAGKFACPLPL